MLSERKKRNIQIAIKAQKAWIEQNGGNVLGYVAKYGSITDPVYSGNGGEAIYTADMNELVRLEKMAA
jgi:hypothetical protein